MSTSLYWRPAVLPPPSNELPYQLKALLARRIWDHDGSLLGAETVLEEGVLGYLEGLSDCGVEGAPELIAAIREHGRVVVWIAS